MYVQAESVKTMRHPLLIPYNTKQPTTSFSHDDSSPHVWPSYIPCFSDILCLTDVAVLMLWKTRSALKLFVLSHCLKKVQMWTMLLILKKTRK